MKFTLYLTYIFGIIVSEDKNNKNAPCKIEGLYNLPKLKKKNIGFPKFSYIVPW